MEGGSAAEGDAEVVLDQAKPKQEAKPKPKQEAKQKQKRTQNAKQKQEPEQRSTQRAKPKQEIKPEEFGGMAGESAGALASALAIKDKRP